MLTKRRGGPLSFSPLVKGALPHLLDVDGLFEDVVAHNLDRRVLQSFAYIIGVDGILRVGVQTYRQSAYIDEGPLEANSVSLTLNEADFVPAIKGCMVATVSMCARLAGVVLMRERDSASRLAAGRRLAAWAKHPTRRSAAQSAERSEVGLKRSCALKIVLCSCCVRCRSSNAIGREEERKRIQSGADDRSAVLGRGARGGRPTRGRRGRLVTKPSGPPASPSQRDGRDTSHHARLIAYTSKEARLSAVTKTGADM